MKRELLKINLSGSTSLRFHWIIFKNILMIKIAANTLYIDSMIVLNNLRYNGEGESGFHLMSENMFCRLDPLLNALLYNSYGIVNLLMEGRVCMYKVDSSKACIGNYCP
jgi:hypothetical protein